MSTASNRLLFSNYDTVHAHARRHSNAQARTHTHTQMDGVMSMDILVYFFVFLGCIIKTAWMRTWARHMIKGTGVSPIFSAALANATKNRHLKHVIARLHVPSGFYLASEKQTSNPSGLSTLSASFRAHQPLAHLRAAPKAFA